MEEITIVNSKSSGLPFIQIHRFPNMYMTISVNTRLICTHGKGWRGKEKDSVCLREYLNIILYIVDIVALVVKRLA